jgi:hypothetical protein
MQTDEVVVRASISISNTYTKEIPFELAQIIRTHLYLVYGAGVDEGRRQRAHGKPVLQMKDGAIIEEFETAKLAANRFKVHKSSICHAATGMTRTCKGFDWRYKGEENNWKYKRKNDE